MRLFSDCPFVCDNGLVIPFMWLCDTENDCKDYSDESEACQILGRGNKTMLIQLPGEQAILGAEAITFFGVWRDSVVSLQA